MSKEFTKEDLEKRQAIIEGVFDVQKNAKALIELIP
jgi:hypothetical protein